VSVAAAPAGLGRLRVTVTTTGAAAPISALRFGPATNAIVDAPGAPAALPGNFNVAPPSGSASYTFVIQRTAPSVAAQVPFVVVDACGEWPSFAGGGPGSF